MMFDVIHNYFFKEVMAQFLPIITTEDIPVLALQFIEANYIQNNPIFLQKKANEKGTSVEYEKNRIILLQDQYLDLLAKIYAIREEAIASAIHLNSDVEAIYSYMKQKYLEKFPTLQVKERWMD